ncbi:replication initiator protein A [Deinococcus sonorensis]|uniref:Replication initiator protein A n=2 Tax=Deinococcus sonorensis TaxID=309891 RepID=A0AAU7UHG6_9DEIO
MRRSASPPPPSSAPRALERFDEANVARLGLISIQERIPDGHNSWSVEFTVEGRPARLSCDALPKHGGVPHGLDNDVSLALITLFMEDGSPQDGTFSTSAYQILTVIGLDTSGHYYRALKESLDRLTTATYTASEAWRKPDGRWTTVKFRYIDRLEYTSDDDRLSLTGGSILRITLAREIVHSIRAQHIKPLDLTFLTSLQRPLTRALYRLLDAQRRQPESLTVLSIDTNIIEWAKACKIVDLKPAKIKRTLDGAHEELLQRGYLRQVSYTGRGTKQVISYQFAHEVTSIPDPELVGQLTAFGVTPGMARSLAQQYPEERLLERIERFRGMVARGYSPRSRAAMLVDVIRDEEGKYADPEGFVTADQRQRSEQQRLQSERLLQQRLDEEDERRSEQYAALTPQARAEQALKTVSLMLGRRLTVSMLAALRDLVLRGELDGADLVKRTTRAAMDLKLEDLSAELTELVRSRYDL